jgi:hypothetical protein
LVSQVLVFSTGENYEAVARLWLRKKKYGVANVITSAVC